MGERLAHARPERVPTVLSSPPYHLMRERPATSPEGPVIDTAYLGIVEGSPFGVYIVDADFRLITMSQGARKVFSAVKDPIGRDFAEVMAVLWPEPFLGEALGRFRHTLATGESYHSPRTVEQRADSGDLEAYDWKLDRVRLPDGRWAVVCYFYDMTEREQQQRQLRGVQEQQAFLLRLNDATQSMADPKAVASATAELLAQHLGAARCVYGSIDDDEVFHLQGEWRNAAMPPMPPSLRVEDLGDLDLRQGRTVVIHDTGSDARVNEEAFDDMGRMRAAIGVPLVKAGRLVAGFGVLDHRSRQWSATEVQLVEEVCARTWASVERATAEEALALSEEKYRTLFGSIDEGFCIIEFFDGPHGPLSDYVHVEANPAYTTNAGIPDVVGKTVRAMIPDEAEGWVRIYREVLLTGKPVRFERELIATGRHLELSAFRVDPVERRQVAVLFNDISQRKEAEASARRSHERYQAFMHHSAEGIWRCELDKPMPVDLPVADMVDFAYVHAYLAECNDAMARMYGFNSGKELEGARLGDLIPRTPENEAYLGAFFRNGFKMIGGESEEKHRDGHTMYFSNNLVGMVEDHHVVRVWGTQSDISERRRAEADLALLASVSVDLVALNSSSVLTKETGDHILQHFRINRISIADVDITAGKAEVYYDHHLPGVPDIAGQRVFSGWRGQGSLAHLSKGEPYVVDDVTKDPDINGAAYLTIGVGALLTIPISRDGAVVSFFSVTSPQPRVWNDSDVDLLKELAVRIWSAFERVKAEGALQRELASTRLLAEVSTSMVHSGETERLFERIVQAAARIMGSRFGSLRKFRKERGELQLVASYGYPVEARERWSWVKPGGGTICGRAMQERARVVVPDVGECEWLKSSGAAQSYLEIGMRAVQSTPLLARDGEPIGVISTHWDRVHTPTAEDLQLFDVLARQAADLIERVRNERLLRENESRFRMATDTGRVGVWEWHIPMDVVKWNDVLYDIQGIRKEDFGGNVEAFSATVHPDDRARVDAAIQGSLQNDTPYAVEFRAVRPVDGRVVRLVTHARVLRDAHGQPERMVGAVVDITAVREAEEALLAADRRKDEFLATLAHELRNPLAPLRNGLEVLRTGAAEPGTLEQIRDMMDRQVNHMVHLVDDLLDLSRISRGVIELRLADVDVHQAVHQAVEASKPLLLAKEHKLLLELGHAPLIVHADSTRLAQVFGNLLDNASKYTDRGGTIHITSGVSDGHAEISIRDTGIGLTQDQVPKVFDMFSQVDRKHDRTRGGLGIGLHIVKRLVQMHGGSIAVASEGLDMGSRFTLRLPLSPVTVPTKSLDEQAGAGQPLRVLLTDDNVDAATMLALLLRKAGHRVVVAHSGEEALAKGAGLEPQAIVLDIGMPGMDGYETCRRMRQLAWGRTPCIIALTGWGQNEDRKRSQEAGFDHHLVKPVERAELLKVLATVKA